jgi:hypothetical protein
MFDGTIQRSLTEQLRADPTGHSSALLNDSKVLIALLYANAVIGMPVKGRKHDGKLDVSNGAKVGVSCALCRTVTDGAVFNMPGGGSIGHRLDGLATYNLDVGTIFASAANSRALYPTLQLSLKANGGKTLGRAPTGLTARSTEADVDAYLSNKDYVWIILGTLSIRPCLTRPNSPLRAGVPFCTYSVAPPATRSPTSTSRFSRRPTSRATVTSRRPRAWKHENNWQCCRSTAVRRARGTISAGPCRQWISGIY